MPPTGRGPAPELSAAPSLPSVHTAPDTQCPPPNAHPPAGTWLDLSGILGQTQVSCRVESQIALSSEPLHGSLSEHQSRALSLALCPAHQAKPRPGSPEPCPAEPVLPGLARSSSPPPCPAHFCLVCLPPSCACRSPSPVHADDPLSADSRCHALHSPALTLPGREASCFRSRPLRLTGPRAACLCLHLLLPLPPLPSPRVSVFAVTAIRARGTCSQTLRLSHLLPQHHS